MGHGDTDGQPVARQNLVNQPWQLARNNPTMLDSYIFPFAGVVKYYKADNHKMLQKTVKSTHC